jgi:PAS domain S-box-containing protein
MALFSSVRNFLVGNQRIESRTAYKNALLRGGMALLALFVGFAYIVIDYASAITYNNVFYVAVIIFASMTIWLNRLHRFHLANLLFLLTLNFIIFLFSSRDLYRTGTYMFFICISLSAFALFGFRQIKFAFAFVALSLLLFVLSYVAGYSPLHLVKYEEMYITLNFTVNFLIALVTSVMIVYFLININYHSEQELIQTTLELSKSRERNEMVVEAVNAGIYEWCPGENSIFVSAAWKRLLGYHDDDLKDFSIEFYMSLIHPDDQVAAQENFRVHLQDKKPYFSEMRLRTKSGTYAWFMDSGITKFNDDGKPQVTVGSIIGINERKIAEDKILKQNELLAKANTELDQFVYSVSHDLRAPLSSILGLTNVYQLTTDAAEKATLVKLIRDRANILDTFIRDILDYSRNSRTILKLQTVNILQVVQEVVDSLSYMSGLNRIQLDIDVSPEIELTTDRERLKVVFSNLLGNAVKYSSTSKESVIKVSSAISGQTLSLSVADNGIGIQPEHLPKIFDMFYQAHDTAQGSGLGLYIVRETVEKLHGTILVESKYGIGSIFTIQLPI